MQRHFFNRLFRRFGLGFATFAGAAFLMGAVPVPQDSVVGSLNLVGTAEARYYDDYDYDRLFRRYYRELSHYGHWVETRKYGLVWVPQVRRNWRPYSVGRWVWTHDYGWLWRSREPWGGVTYHYGWWEWNRRLGWFWVPGYVWAPAWVSFYYSGDTIGWSPIPAWAVWGDRFDDYFYSYNSNPWWYEDRRYRDYWRDDDVWCFVRAGDFGRRDVDTVIVPVTQNNIYIDNSTTIVNITNVTIINQTIVNNSLTYDSVSAVADAPVQIADVETTTSLDDVVGDRRGRRDREDRVEIFRPEELTLPELDEGPGGEGGGEGGRDGRGREERMRDALAEVGNRNASIASDVLPPDDAPRPEIVTDTLGSPDAGPDVPEVGREPELPPALEERLPDVPPELAPEPRDRDRDGGGRLPDDALPDPVPDYVPPSEPEPRFDPPPPVEDEPRGRDRGRDRTPEPEPEPRYDPPPVEEPVFAPPPVEDEPRGRDRGRDRTPEPEPEPRYDPPPVEEPAFVPPPVEDEPRDRGRDRQPEPEPEPEPRYDPPPVEEPVFVPPPEPEPEPRDRGGEGRRRDRDEGNADGDEEPPAEGDE